MSKMSYLINIRLNIYIYIYILVLFKLNYISYKMHKYLNFKIFTEQILRI